MLRDKVPPTQISRFVRAHRWIGRNTANIAFASGVFGTAIIVLAARWLFIGDGYYSAKVDVMSLNLVGDALSGFAATLAVLWLIIGAIMQRHELKLTQRELEETLGETRKQTRLNHRSAQANYQLAIFDRRMDVFNRYLTTVRALVYHGELDDTARKAFYSAANDSRFLFGQDVVQYFRAVDEHVSNYDKHKRRIAHYDKTEDARGELPGDQKRKRDLSWEEVHKEEEWFYENMTDDKIDAVFMPHLTLADKIAAPEED